MKRLVFACLSLLISAGVQAFEDNHVQLATSSAHEAVKWYVQHLPCTEVAGRDDAIDCTGQQIEFVVRPSIGSSQGTGINHIAFGYADAAQAMADFENVGVRGSGVRLQRFEDGTTVQDLGDTQHGYIFDPWGTRIEIIGDVDRIGFHHIGLESTDPAAAKAWYQANLGAEDIDGAGDVTGFRLGGALYFIDQYAEARPAPTDERAIDHLGFVSADLDQVVAALNTAGANVQDPGVPEGGRSDARRAFLSGPDGVLIALVESGWNGFNQDVSFAAVAVEDAAAEYTQTMTPWGEPDLQGIWTSNTAHGIPLERPEDVAEGELTAEQAVARRERGTLGSIWGYEREWRDTTLGYVKSAPSRQVAMIIDPPDGRMPEMTEKGKAAMAAIAEARANPQLAGGPEELSTWVRCITQGLPRLMMPSIYNNGLQIVQSPGYVAIQKEMIHETRVIPTTDKPRHGVKQWLGSSRGYWDGNTLVVEVKGFNGGAEYMGAGENLTLTERYTRVGENQLEYKFTISDPTVWTADWTGMFHFDKDDDQYELVEYACHEGNYGMSNILSAARAKERQAAEPSGE